MTEDYFDRLDAELSALTRRAAHLSAADGRERRIRLLMRRTAVLAVLGLALAMSLISEFPASASGHQPLPIAAIHTRL